jgi:putative ABC transport system ATP-binding protein
MTRTASSYAIDIQGLRYSWPGQAALLSVDSLEIEYGSTVLLQGPSGSGKTTLLSLVTGVLAPSQGQIRILGQDLASMKPTQRDAFRGESMGVIFQLFNLLPFLTVLDNVCLPLRLFPKRRASMVTRELMRAEASRLIGALGLPQGILARQTHQLSVGQQQRVAAARALIGAPPLIIADEPTSALDEPMQQEFLALLIAQVRQTGATLFMVSHDSRISAQFDRVVRL